MSWDGLLGQPGAVQYLRAALCGGRRAQGYLFSGPAGVGKRTAALLLARVALCQNPPAPDLACGSCRSCRWLPDGCALPTGHPDIVAPHKFGLTGDDRGEMLADRELVIPLLTIQRLSEQLYRTPAQGRCRVAIIPEAHRLCRGQAEAANSFLKALEEPPPGALIILTSSQPEAFLETIVSRVQPVRFKRLARAQVEEGLRVRLGEVTGETEEKKGRERKRRKTAAVLADGSLGRALELTKGDLGDWLAWLAGDAEIKVQDAPPIPAGGLSTFGPRSWLEYGKRLWEVAEAEGQRLFEGRGEDAAGEGQAEAEPGNGDEAADDESRRTEAGWKRFVLIRLLELQQAAFRDALLVAAAGGASEPHAPLWLDEDKSRLLTDRFARQFGVEGCDQVLQALNESLAALRLYVRGDLVARVLAGRMYEALRT